MLCVIGGSGLEKLFEDSEEVEISTPYGKVVAYRVKSTESKEFLFIPRHGKEHEAPPHKLNHHANIMAAKLSNAKIVVGINSVGSLTEEIKPGSVVLPSDFLDFTKHVWTYFEDEVVHVDMTNPYSERLISILKELCEKARFVVHTNKIYVCTAGPRFETPAEIRMYGMLGAHVVGMTSVPEAVLAREQNLEYASLCVVTNYAAGMQSRITLEEVFELMKRVQGKLKNVITELAEKL